MSLQARRTEKYCWRTGRGTHRHRQITVNYQCNPGMITQAQIDQHWHLYWEIPFMPGLMCKRQHEAKGQRLLLIRAGEEKFCSVAHSLSQDGVKSCSTPFPKLTHQSTVVPHTSAVGWKRCPRAFQLRIQLKEEMYLTINQFDLQILQVEAQTGCNTRRNLSVHSFPPPPPQIYLDLYIKAAGEKQTLLTCQVKSL